MRTAAFAALCMLGCATAQDAARVAWVTALPVVAEKVADRCAADADDVLSARQLGAITQVQAEAAYLAVSARCQGAAAMLKLLQSEAANGSDR